MAVKKTETTIWGNNYYYPWWQLTTQWQQNSLVNTGAVAWIPDNINLDNNTVWNAQQTSWTKIEETIWGNNYYYPNGQLTTQWQQNALNGTGHVAWIPQWPQTSLIEPIQPAEVQPAPVEATPTQQKPKTTKKTTKQPSTPTFQEQEIQPSEDIVNWEIPESWKKKEEEQPTNNNNEQAVADMENDLANSANWMLYGKVTADEWGYGNAIQTQTDAYNAEIATNQARIANFKKLQSMSSEDIATSITWWYTPYGDQAMRDLMQYNPEKYAEVQQFIKEQKWQNSINSITTGNTSWINTTQTSIDNVNNWVDSWADSLSTSPQQAWQLITNISTSMSNNWVATTATQEMLNLNAQMADIQEKMANVKKEAQKAFKWDVPQYIVDAFANNRLQEYQSQYNKLESRYNAAMDLYKTELSNAQWQEEMNLKKLQYQQDVSMNNWKMYYQNMQLKQDSIKRVDGKAYQLNYDWTMTQISDTTAYTTYQQNTSQLLQWYIAQYTNGWATKTANWYKYNISWWQCEAFTDNFTEAATWLRMTWANGRWWTTAEEKIWYINSFTPEVWSVAVAVWWAYDSTYWHTMLVTWYDPTTQMVDLLWSNNNGDEMVYSSSMSLSQLMNSWVKGFRNPYYDMAAQQATNSENSYWYFNTPMASVFDRLTEDTSLNAGQKSKIPVAMEMYNTLYGIVSDGSWDALANSKDVALIYQDMKNQSFGTTNDDWAAFKKALQKSIRNRLSETTSGTQAYNALLNLQRLIELKLRDESWAAISSSERMSNFSMLLPQAWESAASKQNKLNTWNNIIATKFISSGWKSKEYVAIWVVPTTREIW